MRDELIDRVGDVMREVARDCVMPRFQALQSGDVEEKAPGDWVTIVDREAEQALTAALAGLAAGSRVVGEEQTALDPRSLQGLGSGLVWLVDPLDGTANFIAGRPEFAVMVALLREGETVEAWILDPARDVLLRASRGAGAWEETRRLLTPQAAPEAAALRGVVMRKYMPPDVRHGVEGRLSRIGATLPGAFCAGKEYPALVAGHQDFILYYRTLPWDHAPGALLVTEAGGVAARYDGTPYRPADERPGLLVATNRGTWDLAHAALLG